MRVGPAHHPGQHASRDAETDQLGPFVAAAPGAGNLEPATAGPRDTASIENPTGRFLTDARRSSPWRSLPLNPTVRRWSRSRTSPTAMGAWWRSMAFPSIFPAACMVGIIGPDGVGKSTLMALIAGSKKMQQGKVIVLDGDIADAQHRARRVPADRLHAPGFGQEPLPGTQRPGERRFHGADSSDYPPRSVRSASRNCSMPPDLARFPGVPPANSRAE